MLQQVAQGTSRFELVEVNAISEALSGLSDTKSEDPPEIFLTHDNSMLICPEHKPFLSKILYVLDTTAGGISLQGIFTFPMKSSFRREFSILTSKNTNSSTTFLSWNTKSSFHFAVVAPFRSHFVRINLIVLEHDVTQTAQYGL